MAAIRAALAMAVVLALVACDGGDGGDDSSATTAAPLTALAGGPVAATELVAGDCLRGIVIGAAERARLDSAQLVGCEGPHDLEVFATFDLDEATLAADGLYPGEEPVVDTADAGCDERLTELGDVAGELGLIAIWPTAVSWSQGDRTVACVAFPSDRMPFQGPVLVGAG